MRRSSPCCSIRCDPVMTPATSPERIRVLDFLRGVAPRAERFMTVCNGAALAASAGLLDGRRATTNKVFFDTVEARGEKVKDAALLDRLLAAYETKYPAEIADWRDKMRSGYADGTRTLVRYTPASGV